MDKEITAAQAWVDFFGWIKKQPKWRDIPRLEKQYMYKASKDHRDGRLGYDRIKNILTKYGQGRYEFRETVILKEI